MIFSFEIFNSIKPFMVGLPTVVESAGNRTNLRSSQTILLGAHELVRSTSHACCHENDQEQLMISEEPIRSSQAWRPHLS